MDVEAIQRWVLEVHERTRPSWPDVVLNLDGPVSAEAGTGLWWAVLNVEACDFEPESLWRERAEAQLRADALNEGQYPSWQVLPAALAWWMRNEFLPDEAPGAVKRAALDRVISNGMLAMADGERGRAEALDEDGAEP